jgi:hypothetical protein
VALSQRGQRVLEVARRVFDLEKELSVLHEELESIVGAGPGRVEEQLESSAGFAEVGGDVQGAVLAELRSRPGQLRRAAELKVAIGGNPAKGSVESALQRLVARGLIERVGRGAYAFRASELKR